MTPKRKGLFGIPWLAEIILLAIAIAAYFLFPYNLGFLTRILIMIIFVLSIDLVLGYAGIATLGQAALYGSGAYAAGLFSLHFWADPIAGLLVGAVVGAIVAVISGLLLMRAIGLTLLMISIAIMQVLREVANKAQDITGGDDGLGGIRMEPILGMFEFDFIGKTGYWYALTVLVVIFLFLKMLVASPFGLALRGIHESPDRMKAIGTPVYWRLVIVYTIGGAIAGIAGALAAQVTQLVSLEVFSFALSADAVVMVVLGGTGRLYGAIIGTILFMTVHHTAAAIDPFNWLFAIGALVLIVIFFVPKGVLGLPTALKQLFRRSR